ncbi:ATP-grasp fold amidoligase family protein [Sphingomonas solaris]|uniref:ATP-grasp domain-containing protein n=1 Tax=Alterirhizorhabdus solaris TaxID=2529389 RepID=A0A558R7T6_9SPHN|nr:ATP-grasp fold amidoligase family protein [Sphingomonas solaris]TVV75362.1 hypothetical protein FOY91_07195 [Sphingomonas solaris]
MPYETRLAPRAPPPARAVETGDGMKRSDAEQVQAVSPGTMPFPSPDALLPGRRGVGGPGLRVADSRLSSPGWDAFRRAAPMTRAFNHLVAGVRFREKFGRWPLPPADPAATVNDLVFARMIDPCWSPLQRAFVDKETAKAQALRRAPWLRVPETLAVVAMDDVRSVEDLYARLLPFAGTNAIAKPANASGAATFMRDVASPADLRDLHDLASVDYAVVMREMQYRGLPGKVIVEALIPAPAGRPPDDCKFHCVRGEPLVCQIDHDRFGAAWSRLFRVPDFVPMHAGDGLDRPEGHRLPAPARLAAMIAAARALAESFDYVRVDLYDGADGVYFGELTFTPAASLGIAPSSEGCHRVSETHRVFSRIVMDAIRRA